MADGESHLVFTIAREGMNWSLICAGCGLEWPWRVGAAPDVVLSGLLDHWCEPPAEVVELTIVRRDVHSDPCPFCHRELTAEALGTGRCTWCGYTGAGHGVTWTGEQEGGAGVD